MKKVIYYSSPFIVFPIIFILLEILDDSRILELSPLIMFAVILVTTAIIGNLSPSDRLFDLIITIILPLSLICTMLIAGFLDKDDMETRFHIDRALEAAFQPLYLQLCLISLLTAFLFSFKKIRLIKILKRR